MSQDQYDANANPYYAFKVGHFDCMAISDGCHSYQLNRFFANVPEEQIVAALRQRHWPTDHIATPYTCLYVNTGENHIMVDTGAGSYFATAGKLAANLKTAGVSTAEIDTVIITHAHPDHVGGLVAEGDHLIFPDAHYYIWKDEWDFWFSDSALAQAPKHFVVLARKHLEAIEYRVTLLDSENTIVPGIQAVSTPGHTPGHMALSITSENAQLLHVSDVVLSPLHLENPTWVSIYDMMSAAAARSKQLIFDRAAEENALVFAHHFPPFPSLGYVFKHENAWGWRPIELSTTDHLNH